MAQFFAEGGFAMWPIALVGLFAVILGGVGLGTRSKGAALGALGCAAAVTLLGVGGMMWGRMKTDEAIAYVEPRYAEELRAQGHREANRPLQLAGGFVVLGAALGLAGFTRATSRNVL
ncbi:MAG: hypothetical protein JNK82_13495 [Myxococcaceae bacterium]|nr:hypothetical protein [Myxococcaceae bacterium]